MKQIPVLKARIGIGNFIPVFLSVVGGIFQFGVLVIIAIENAPQLVSVLWKIIRLRKQPFCVLHQMLCSLVLGRNRHNIYQAVAGTEMLEIFDLRFFSLTDYINDGPTFATACFIWVVFFPHSCHKPSPPINGIAPKRPCKYPLRMFSPFLGEKDASEYSSVAQDRSSFSANQI